MNRRKKKASICLLMALAITVLTSGCQILSPDSEEETKTDSESISETALESVASETGSDTFETMSGTDFESMSEADSESSSETDSELMSEVETGTDTEIETETEYQTDVEYISEDETICVTLPDSTWKATQDEDKMRVFSSGSDAMLNIVHAYDESSMEDISVLATEDELENSLESQYTEEEAFEILLFEEKSSSDVITYEYVVKYNDSVSMWAYSVTYTILSADMDEAYVVSGTVTEDDETLLDAVQASVESFKVLDEDSIFYVLPGSEEETDTAETEDESIGAEELASLTEYSTAVTMYTSSDVNIREYPSTEAERIGSLAEGSAATVTGETLHWFQIDAGESAGYISKDYLISAEEQTDAENGEEDADTADSSAELATSVSYSTASIFYTTDWVNLRVLPSTESTVVCAIASGTAVTVIGETDNWYIVSLEGETGYISKAYLSSAQSSSSNSAGGTDSGGETLPAESGTTSTASSENETVAASN
ncbi:MAG: SH3 domain-containing protein [Lachnospiraceae bacterium]|nr:SH3 domain-containing protein [Lachnospiraceae bacterium]